MSREFCKPTKRGSLTVPPIPGNKPSLTSGKAIIVEEWFVAIRPAHDKESSVPPPIQNPCIAATIGLDKSSIFFNIECPAKAASLACCLL